MIRTCSFVLDNGRRCHCAATRGQDCCRHHTPETLALHRAAQPGSPDPEQAFSPRREWGQLRHYIGYCNEESIPDLIEDLMLALATGAMTPRTAGRFLLLLHNRREDLRREQREAELQTQIDRLCHTGESPLPRQHQAAEQGLAEGAR